MIVSAPKQSTLFDVPRKHGGPIKRRQSPEFRLQCAVADMLWKLARPTWFWSAIPSGEKRSIETGERLKRMGLKPGMFDLILIGPSGQHYWLELKADKGVLSPAQLDFEGMLCGRGVSHAVVWGFGEAERQLRDWGVLRPEATAIRSKQGGAEPDPRPLRDPVGPGSTR